MPFDKETVEKKANEIRVNSLKMIHAAKSGHPGGSLSIADILSVLYFGDQLKHDPSNSELADRDILIVSKGHSSPAVYSALGLAGFYPLEDTMSFRQLGSNFQGHIDRMRVPGVEISTGSLGHGLSNSLGMALASKLNNESKTIFTILSDGELQEGSNWEAIMAAAHFKTNNLIAILDRNRIQLDGWTETTMGLDPIKEKLLAFNWDVQEINGHDVHAINEAISNAKASSSGKPQFIIAATVKGKGVSFMEDQVAWHGVAPKDEDLEKALAELS